SNIPDLHFVGPAMCLVSDVPTGLPGIGQPDREPGEGWMLEPLFPLVRRVTEPVTGARLLPFPNTPDQIVDLFSRLHDHFSFGHALAPKAAHFDAAHCQR